MCLICFTFFLIIFLSEGRISFFPPDLRGNTYSLLNMSFKFISPKSLTVKASVRYSL